MSHSEFAPPPEIRSRSTGVLVPAYQAAATLAGVLQGLMPYRSLGNILVVDDGSTDGTAALAESLGVKVLKHPVNRGKGSALMTGLVYARDVLDWEWAITVDADGQHHPEDLEGFLACRPHVKTGIVVGARARAGTAMPWHRRFSNASTTWLVSHLAGTPVGDAQCGYRAYRLELVASLDREGRFEWESHALIRAARAGFGIECIPVRTVYGDQGSHMNLWRDSVRFLKMAFRHRSGRKSPAWTR